MAPGEQEERQGKPFVGPAGVLLRSALTDAGIGLSTVGFANLGRCRPEGDDFESAAWEQAEKRCWQYLATELAQVPRTTPLLLLGTRPLQRMMGDKNERVTRRRGLWIATADGRKAFVARHPSSILRGKEVREKLEVQFREDLRRMADTLLGRERGPTIHVQTYPSLSAAKPFLAKLARHPGPWVFDIETYDALQCPSRSYVSLDPCHPDFRVRGIAFALSATWGAWVELIGATPEQARPLLSPVFGSGADKWAFNGSFDEEGVVYPGWATEVMGRRGDGMLGLVALGYGRHESLQLEKAIVDVLKQPQAWGGVDKTRVQELSLEDVARGSVRDACYTFALCEYLHGRLERAEYLEI